MNGVDLHKAVARKDLAAVVYVLNAGYEFALLINFMLTTIEIFSGKMSWQMIVF